MFSAPKLSYGLESQNEVLSELIAQFSEVCRYLENEKFDSFHRKDNLHSFRLVNSGLSPKIKANLGELTTILEDLEAVLKFLGTGEFLRERSGCDYSELEKSPDDGGAYSKGIQNLDYTVSLTFWTIKSKFERA